MNDEEIDGICDNDDAFKNKGSVINEGFDYDKEKRTNLNRMRTLHYY